MQQEIFSQVDKYYADLVTIATALHEEPELGYKEVRAHDLLVKKAESYGFEVEPVLMNMPTAFSARYGQGGPTIAFLLEYDALPGLGHACGHNLIAAISFVAGCSLLPAIDRYGGQILLLGTPAEETDGAKVRLAKEPWFMETVDVAMMVHPGNKTMVEVHTLALEALEIRFVGKAAHAASAPHEGRNALEGVIALFNGINSLRQHVRPDVRMHGIIVKGGIAPNVIPDEAVAQFYFRAADRPYLNVVLERVREIIQGAALLSGTEVSYRSFEAPLDEIVSNPTLVKLFSEAYTKLGVTIDVQGALGSTDFGNISRVVPGVHPSINIGHGLVGHTPAFAVAAKTEYAFTQATLAAKAMADTALSLLQHPELVVQAKKELQALSNQ